MTYTPEQIPQINLKMNLSLQEKRDLAMSTSSADILRSLATDEDFWVRYWVAHNTNTPEDAIRTLAKETLRKQLAKEIEEDAIRYHFNPNYKPGPYKTLELTKVQYYALKQLIDSCKNTDLLNINI
jgi:hypothetical protein